MSVFLRGVLDDGAGQGIMSGGAFSAVRREMVVIGQRRLERLGLI